MGNKTDLEDKREVSQEEAIDLSIKEEYIYKETSCVKNENVADAFETIIEMWNIYNKKNNEGTIKRSKSKDNLTKHNTRTESFSLTERSTTFDKKDNEDDENVKLKKTNKISLKKYTQFFLTLRP